MTIRFCLDGIKDISLLHPDVTPSEFDDGLIRILSFGHSDYFRTVISESAISNHLAVNANSSYFGNEWYTVSGIGQYHIHFSVDTFLEKANCHLEVKISVEQCKNDAEIEQLKYMLKSRLLKDWNKCTWLQDDQSERMSAEVYPHIAKVENELRAFASKVLIHELGIDWLQRSGLETVSDSVRSREKDFKQTVRNFADINTDFYSMTMEDLVKVITNGKVYKEDVVCLTSDIVKRIKKSIKERRIDSAQNLIENHQVTDINIWDQLFAPCFDDLDTTSRLFTALIKNRNHIAHNKIITTEVKAIILQETNELSKQIKKAEAKYERGLPSFERRVREELSGGTDEQLYRIRVAQETGLEILDWDGILSKFNESIQWLYGKVYDHYHYDACFEVSEFHELKGEGVIVVFAVTSNADPNSVLEIIASVMIDDDLDEDSYVTITCTVGKEIVQKVQLRYHNGNGAEGDNGLMYATVDSEYEDNELLDLPDVLFEYIDEKLNPFVQKLEEVQTPNRSEGDQSIVADFPCEWCGRYGVSLDDSFYKVGYCCYCGSENSINVCAKCGRVYSAYDGDEHFCNSCLGSLNE